MNFEDIKTIILVDDKAISHSDGGNGATPRQNRYKILFLNLEEKMKNVEKEYLILGDGIFETNDKSKTLKKIGEEIFFDNSDSKKIRDKIQTLSGGKKTLLLIDYRLNNSEKNQKKGEALARDIILKLTLKNIIKQLYSTSPQKEEDEKIMNDLELTCVFDFPIASPTDAAEEIIQMLENRGDLNV